MDTTREASLTTPTAEIEPIIEQWTTAELAPASQRRMADLARRYAARLTATGHTSLWSATPADCEAFIWAVTRRNQPPSLHTAHLRRTTLRAIYRTLRATDPAGVDPTRDVALPPKTQRVARPLDDAEVLLVRTTSLGRRRQPLRIAAMVALAEATATTSEIAAIRWRDIDLTHGHVGLPGAPPVQPRIGQLTGWGLGVVRRLHTELEPHPGDAVTHRGRSPVGSHAGQATTSNVLARLLADAGVRDDDTKPTSLRLWAARAALDRGSRIEEVARQLGVTSLDAAAEAVGYSWQAR